MKILPLKSSVEKQEIKQDGKPCDQVEFTKGITKNLTTLDTIGLVVLSMWPSVLFQGMRIESDSRRENNAKLHTK